MKQRIDSQLAALDAEQCIAEDALLVTQSLLQAQALTQADAWSHICDACERSTALRLTVEVPAGAQRFTVRLEAINGEGVTTVIRRLSAVNAQRRVQ
jgi:hypothetical protein